MTCRSAPRDRTRHGLRSWWRHGALLCLIALIAACRSAPVHEAGRVDMTPLGVVTLNLWHDRNDWPRRQAIIVDELKRLSPDVILLQEVLQDTALPNQARTLAGKLGYDWHFVSVDAPERARRYGNAILTREPIAQRGARALPPVDDYRIAGWVRTTVRGRVLDVYVVHLTFTDRSGATRARQLHELADFVAATRSGAAVIGGDFNTTATTAELSLLRDDYFDVYAASREGVDVETPEHATLNARFNPPARIDLIQARRDAFCRPEAHRILDRPAADGAWASDHFGVWVRLPWRTERCD